MKLVIGFIFSLVLLLSIVPFSFAQQGCCSWHDGISHCDSSTGRYVCNDGTYSPSCTCGVAPETDFDFTINTPEPNEHGMLYCGAGDWFSTEDEATVSLEVYRTEIEDPLRSEIAILSEENGKLELKTWASLILLVGVALLVYYRNESKIAKILLYIVFYAFLFGGFVLLLP